MKRSFTPVGVILTAAVAWVSMCANAHAILYLNKANATYAVPTSYSDATPQSEGSNLSLSELQKFLQDQNVSTDIGSLLYKFTRDKSLEESTFTGSYNTTPIPSTTPLRQYKIEYVAPNPAVNATYLMVKGPNGQPTYLWSLQNWDGKETIIFTDDTFTKTKARSIIYQNFSHFQIIGTKAAVPEASSVVAAALMLVPFGFATVRSLRRNNA